MSMLKVDHFKNMNNLNRPVLVMGLNPLLFMCLFILLVVSFLGLKFYIIFLVIPIYFLLSKLDKEKKKGNPDYLMSLNIWTSTKKNIVDSDYCFTFLRKKNYNGNKV